MSTKKKPTESKKSQSPQKPSLPGKQIESAQPPAQKTPPTPAATVTPPPEPNNPIPPAITLESVHADLETLKLVVAELRDTLARKRRPVASNGKVQIRDKTTGKVYPSKNNAYQSLLKAGELKELVTKGLFGDVPEKNTFGWYVLVREMPDRFEEVKEEESPEPEKQPTQA